MVMSITWMFLEVLGCFFPQLLRYDKVP